MHKKSRSQLVVFLVFSLPFHTRLPVETRPNVWAWAKHVFACLYWFLLSFAQTKNLDEFLVLVLIWAPNAIVFASLWLCNKVEKVLKKIDRYITSR